MANVHCMLSVKILTPTFELVKKNSEKVYLHNFIRSLK